MILGAYNDCSVIVGYDGVKAHGLSGCKELEMERAKVDQFGGLWTHRYLEECLSTGNNFFMRIDPDTECIRRMDPMPDYTSGLFGRHFNVKGMKIGKIMRIHGSMLGWTRDAATKCVSSKIFLSSEFQNRNQYRTVDDVMVYRAAELLDLPIHHRDDFECGGIKLENPSFKHK